MLRALNDRVLVRVSPGQAQVGAAGIIVARESRDDEHIGEVVTAGADSAASPGDRVLFQALPRGVSYDTVVVDDEELLVLRERQLLAVFED